jgi:hypothetical protein
MNDLEGISFSDANTGTVVGNWGTLLRTTNGGTTWTSQFCGTNNTLLGVSFIGAHIGTVVGWYNTILHTTNGGDAVSVDKNQTDCAHIAQKYYLNQNYPNPFNPNTTIQFSIPHQDFVSLKIFNILGQEVVTLLSHNIPAGSHSVNWDASRCASGVYFYRLQVGSFCEIKKLLLLK